MALSVSTDSITAFGTPHAPLTSPPGLPRAAFWRDADLPIGKTAGRPPRPSAPAAEAASPARNRLSRSARLSLSVPRETISIRLRHLESQNRLPSRMSRPVVMRRTATLHRIGACSNDTACSRAETGPPALAGPHSFAVARPPSTSKRRPTQARTRKTTRWAERQHPKQACHDFPRSIGDLSGQARWPARPLTGRGWRRFGRPSRSLLSRRRIRRPAATPSRRRWRQTWPAETPAPPAPPWLGSWQRCNQRLLNKRFLMALHGSRRPPCFDLRPVQHNREPPGSHGLQQRARQPMPAPGKTMHRRR